MTTMDAFTLTMRTQSTRRWARRLPDVTAEVACGGEIHHVLLRRGKLVLADHVLGAEAAAVALGAPSPPCFDVYRSWRLREQWEVALAPRGPGFHQLYRRPPLPPALALPLERGFARAWERRAARGDELTAYLLHKAIRMKAEPALSTAMASAVRRFGGGRIERIDLEIRPGPPGVSGVITPAKSELVVEVAPDWLRTVGQPRLALDARSRFVVATEPRPVVVEWESADDKAWTPTLATTGQETSSSK